MMPIKLKEMNNANRVIARSMSVRCTAMLATTVGLTCLLTAQASGQANMVWSSQLGTSAYDVSFCVDVDDAGNSYIAGGTFGNLFGSNAGAADMFLSRYNADGSFAWSRQIGTSTDDYFRNIALDSSGNIFLAGYTAGSLAGPSFGLNDSFLARYNPDGSLAWSKQVGTSQNDASYAVAVDHAGYIYTAGSTQGNLAAVNAGMYDVVVSRFQPDGTLDWSRQIGTATDDYALGITVDAGNNAYITGITSANLGGTHYGGEDIFLARFDNDGTLAWTRQIGTSVNDHGRDIEIDSVGNIYVNGYTEGNLQGINAGGWDTFLMKYDPTATHEWTRQIGTNTGDLAYRMAIDDAGMPYYIGNTGGNLFGTNLGLEDNFLVRYDGNGNVVWGRLIGTSASDAHFDVNVHHNGDVYVSGYSHGSLAGPHVGSFDAFNMKYDQLAGGNWLGLADGPVGPGGNWGTNGNWSVGLSPFSSDDINFNISDTYTVNLTGPALAGDINVNHGDITLALNGHTLSSYGTLTVATDATLRGLETSFDGDEYIKADVNNQGTLAIGNMYGIVNIIGNLDTTGIIEFQLPGAGTGQFDRIVVSGTFRAGGILKITIPNGAAVGDYFDIMDFASLLDNGYTFDLTAAALGPGLAWNTSTFASTGSIFVEAIPEPASLSLLAMVALAMRRRR